MCKIHPTGIIHNHDILCCHFNYFCCDIHTLSLGVSGNPLSFFLSFPAILLYYGNSLRDYLTAVVYKLNKNVRRSCSNGRFSKWVIFFFFFKYRKICRTSWIKFHNTDFYLDPCRPSVNIGGVLPHPPSLIIIGGEYWTLTNMAIHRMSSENVYHSQLSFSH